MFEITITPALSVLPVQHELLIDEPMLELGQTDAGPRPPQPGKLWADTELNLGHTTSGPPPPPPRQLWAATELNLGQTSDGPLPPPPGK